MPRRLQLERAVGRERRLDAVDRLARSARAPAARRARSPRRSCAAGRAARARNASVSASRMRRTSSASCSSSATMSLLISTVLSGSRNRLAPLVDAPCTMPGIAAAMLGLDDQHVAAVALGDDLILQVLRRLLAAQVRLERAAQPRALLAQPVADPLSSGLASSTTSPDGSIFSRTCADLALERRGAAGRRFEERERCRRAADRRRATRRPNRGSRPARAAAALRARGLRRRARRAICGRSADARSGNSAVGREIPRGFGRRREQLRDRAADRSTAASRASRSSPIGVSAKPRTASTMRSNSRARRAAGCIGGEPLIVTYCQGEGQRANGQTSSPTAAQPYASSPTDD